MTQIKSKEQKKLATIMMYLDAELKIDFKKFCIDKNTDITKRLIVHIQNDVKKSKQ